MTLLKRITLALMLLSISSKASALEFLTWSVGDWIGAVDSYVGSADESIHIGGKGWWNNGPAKVTHEFVDKFVVRSVEQEVCSQDECVTIITRTVIRERYE